MSIALQRMRNEGASADEYVMSVIETHLYAPLSGFGFLLTFKCFVIDIVDSF